MSDTFFNPSKTAKTDEDMVTTMGGLSDVDSKETASDDSDIASYLSRIIPNINFDAFTGSADQLAQLFPGIQVKPNYQPGLTDISFTRGFYGTNPDVDPYKYGGAGETSGHLFWSPQRYQLPITAETTVSSSTSSDDQKKDSSSVDSALAALLAMDWGTSTTSGGGGGGGGGGDTTDTDTDTDTDTGGGPGGGGTTGGGGGSTGGGSTVGGGTVGGGTTVITKPSRPPGTWTGGGGTGSGNKGGKGGSSTDDSDSSPGSSAPSSGGGSKGGKGGGGRNVGGGTAVDTQPEGGGGGGGGGGGLTNLDTVGGGTGNDIVLDDTLEGGNGTDTIGGGNTVDTVVGGTGNDTLTGGGLDDAAKLANDETVKKAYENIFNRQADQAGLDYWSSQLDAGKSTTDLLRDMVSGAQGEDAKTASNTQTVNNLYQELLGREADAGGLDYFRAQLEAGAKPEDVARNIISGAKAGSEASEISQAEYDRYFAQPTPSTRPTPQNVDTLFPNVAPGDLAVYKDASTKLTDLARDFMANQDGGYDMASYDPEAFRAAFVSDVAMKDPELFSQISGLDMVPIEFADGLQVMSAMPLISAVNAAFNSDSFADAAGNIDKAFATAGIADVAATALAMAGLPVVGQVAAAAILLDSVLSKALGYDSPIQDGVDWMAQQTEKAAKWISDTFGDIWSGVEDFFGGIGDFFGGIGDWFAEGGLVDLPGDSMYTDESPEMSSLEGFASGGVIPLPGGGKIAKGPGGGLDDLIPTSINGRRAAALSDGEFVIPADVVSMMGDGSSNAGSQRLYDLVKQIRQHKTGTARQAGPLPVGKILERTMK